jgi:DNA-binding CsgD family transcriptional regulator/sugar-specific transcriptional regulator TrmB
MSDPLGLDDIAARVYRTMLTLPQVTVDELSDQLDLENKQVEVALDRLTELSLVRPSYEEDGSLRPISPEVGFEEFLAKQQEALNSQQQRLDESRVAVAKLIAESAHHRRHYDVDVERLEGIDAIRDRLAEFTRGVEHEVSALAPDGPQTEANIEAARPLDEELLARGVHLRTLYLDSIRNHPVTATYAQWLVDQGGLVRTAPSLPVRMILVDRIAAIVPIDEENSGQGAIVLHNSGVLAALCALFDHTWREATPLGGSDVQDTEGLSKQEREVLRLLALGLTDQAVAKRLGVSVRTSSRITALLMERLDARSRFQAGVRASELGWLKELDGQ